MNEDANTEDKSATELSKPDDEKELEELNLYISENQARIEAKAKLRSENLTCLRPSDDFFKKLDSSLKKNTTFVKKLKQFTASQLDSLMKDMVGLNLTKYITEVCSAVVEAKLKMTDVSAIVLLCSKLHQTYAEFSQHFFENWQKSLTMKQGEKIQNPSKMRVDLRLYTELLSVGIFNNKSGLQLLGNVLTGLITQDKDDHSNLSIILSFCRHCGEEYAGLVPKNIIRLSIQYNIILPSSTILATEKQQHLRNVLLREYYNGLCKHLKAEFKDLQATERMNKKIMESKGEVPIDPKKKLEMMQANFEKLLTSAQTLSDLLNEELPKLPKDNDDNSGGIVLDIGDDLQESHLQPWGDEETKSFYIDLPDLRLFLPNYAPKHPSTPPPEETQLIEESLDMENEPDPVIDTEESSAIVEPPEPISNSPETPPEEIQIQCQTNQSTKQYFDNFAQNLANCVSKELIDSAAIDFLLNLNTKNNRKKITKTIFGVQRTRLDLLPFYARFVAIINLVSRDVAVELIIMLKHEFRSLVRKKDQINIETKIKIIRFIGEMTKFGLFPKMEALFCLKLLLQEFQHHHIEMACAFLEVCGTYLYNSKESRIKTTVYLEQMWRLKTVKSINSRHSTQIENSYYLVKPPEGMGLVQKVRPVIFQYIRHLVFEELNKSNVDKMIKLMRRLNWDDIEIRSYAIKCLSKAYNIRYHLIRCLADLVSGLSSYQDKAMMKVIDAVFEDIRAGLEIHSPKLAQRRIAMAKYLGELYIYRLVESSNVLNTLYSIISLGVVMEPNYISDVDPPGSLFRLKLACVLLDTCGQYFTSGMSRKRLDYFLIFFQQYYWFKKSDKIFSEDPKNLFPILVEHIYKECFANVRPKLKLFNSFEEVKEAVDKLKFQLYPELFSNNAQDGAGDGINEPNDMLEPITEVESEPGEITEDNTSEAPLGESDYEGNRIISKDIDNNDDILPYDEVRMNSPSSDLLFIPKKHVPTQDDLEFEQAFERMASDSYQERLRESIKPNTKDIPVPMMSKSSKKTYEQLQDSEPTKSSSSVPFVLMLRGSRGGKQTFKTFDAPSDSQLAVNLKLQEQKIKEENEKVKRLTLNITERIEEEDYQESLQQTQRFSTQNKYVKQNKPHKYKHQKGVPDADQIFQ